MKRCLYSAQSKLNPVTTEKLKEEHRSGDTLSDPDCYPWDCEYEKPRKGSVQEGVSMVEPMYSDQVKINRNKRY